MSRLRLVLDLELESDIDMRPLGVREELQGSLAVGWLDDWGEPYAIAVVKRGCVSHRDVGRNGRGLGVPFDATRVLAWRGAYGVKEASQLSDAPAATRTVRSHALIFSTLQLWGNEYYHFHAEQLPKLLVFRELRRHEPGLVALIDTPHAYAAEYVELLSLTSSVVPVGVGDDVCATSSLYLPPPSRPFSPSADAVRFTRATLTAVLAATAAADTASRRGEAEATSDAEEDHHGMDRGSSSSGRGRSLVLVVSRDATRLRRWTNEAECVETLRAAVAHHFPRLAVAVLPSGGLPARETLSLVSRAVLVVGPHGAGLSNVLFARAGAAVLEVPPARDTGGGRGAFPTMADALELRYFALAGNYSYASLDVHIDAASLAAAATRVLYEVHMQTPPPAVVAAALPLGIETQLGAASSSLVRLERMPTSGPRDADHAVEAVLLPSAAAAQRRSREHERARERASAPSLQSSAALSSVVMLVALVLALLSRSRRARIVAKRRCGGNGGAAACCRCLCAPLTSLCDDLRALGLMVLG